MVHRRGTFAEAHQLSRLLGHHDYVHAESAPGASDDDFDPTGSHAAAAERPSAAPKKQKQGRSRAGPPSAALQALKRSQRTRESELRATQRREREELLASFGELELDAVEESGIDLLVWGESGAGGQPTGAAARGARS